MSAERVSSQVESLIEHALDEQNIREEVSYDLAIVPTDKGASLYVTFWMNGAILGTIINSSSFLVNPPLVTQDNINELVRNIVEALRAERSTQLMSIQNGAKAGLDQSK